MTKKQVESFLLNKRGYLKKSPINVARAIWKKSDKHILPKTKTELQKELDCIKSVQSTLRAANDIVTTNENDLLSQIYLDIIEEKQRPKKRLFFDIETSPNVVFSWRIGNNISLSHDNIIDERAIICVCWKWEGEKEVHSFQWNKGDDKALMIKFAKVINSADEVIGQNSDRYDIRWLRARAIFHGVELKPKFNSVDTLKMARQGFNFNCNKLDYMGQYLGFGGKIKTDYDLWKEIVLKNDKEAMNKMVEYCKGDVDLLEDVYHKLQKFSPVKKFKYNK